MKLLHTSDWHLGVKMKRLSCEGEQRAFLNWLVEILDERQVEVLVVAGDIFHHATPSNSARALYYGFLKKCLSLSALRKVVITGGNHDSPSGLEAPRRLLDEFDVHVVGGLSSDPERRARCLCPVEGDDGQVEVVVAAVPYVPESRLGIGHYGDESESELQARFFDAYQSLYADLADRARRMWPEAKLVATGHLACYGDPDDRQEGDFDTELHRSGPADDSRRIGTIGAFSPTVFDERFRYVALGHIHRCYPPAGDHRIWYSGTPVPTNKTERTDRCVLLVDVEPDSGDESVHIERLVVPRWRQIHCLSGTTQQLCDQLEDVKPDDEFAPNLFVDAILDIDEEIGAPLDAIEERLEADFPEQGRPRIAEYRDRYPDTASRETDEVDGDPLEEMTPLDVFLKLYESRHPERDEAPEALVRSFQTVLSSMTDEDQS